VRRSAIDASSVPADERPVVVSFVCSVSCCPVLLFDRDPAAALFGDSWSAGMVTADPLL
jgi:hypothetical protein